MVTARELLTQWLQHRCAADGWAWFCSRRDELANALTDRALYITLGMIPRKLGKQDLSLDEDSLRHADRTREGWDPSEWSVADAARVLVLLDVAGQDGEAFPSRFEELCRHADVGELIALYRGLPLYPGAGALEEQAAEGLRTNMRAVFEAVAHRSPYPRQQFSLARWNQMVLKALFIGSKLYPIQGLDERANPELAQILCDYAHERWAAHRTVSPALWRCVGPFAKGAMLDDLRRVAASEELTERQAAALALTANASSQAAKVLAESPQCAALAADKTIDWTSIESTESR